VAEKKAKKQFPLKKVSNRMSQKCSECRNVTGRCGPISGRYDCIFAINRSLICYILACLTDCLATGAAELTRFAHAKRRSGGHVVLDFGYIKQAGFDPRVVRATVHLAPETSKQHHGGP
jgi:hypothetical protein